MRIVVGNGRVVEMPQEEYNSLLASGKLIERLRALPNQQRAGKPRMSIAELAAAKRKADD
jgi:hypothetical protein